MTPEQSAHLSEEALNDVLIGLGTPESDAHLAACSVCSSRVKEFKSEMGVFNQTTLAWSEARPIVSHRAAATTRVRRAMTSPLGWALAAALLVAAGLTVWSHNHRSSSNIAAVPAQSPEDSAAQIAQDNDLLQSVNVALNETEESPISEYHLLEAPHPRSRTRPELRKQ